MNTNSLAPLLIGGGLLLVLLSVTAPHVLGGRLEWSTEDATRFQQASQNYHAALHGRSHTAQNATPGEDSFAAARDDYLERKASLDAAQARGTNVGAILRWIGIMSSVVGLTLYLIPIVLGDAKPSP